MESRSEEIHSDGKELVIAASAFAIGTVTYMVVNALQWNRRVMGILARCRPMVRLCTEVRPSESRSLNLSIQHARPSARFIQSSNEWSIRALSESSFARDTRRVMSALWRRLLEAAHHQDCCWSALEALFECRSVWSSHDQPDPATIWTIVVGIGLDIGKARLDTQSASVDTVIVREKADFAALKVTRTPIFYVDGRLLTDFGESQRRLLVASELQATGLLNE